MSFIHHQRNFSTSTTTKSEVFSTFEDDEEDIIIAQAAKKKTFKVRVICSAIALILIAGSIGGGVTYMEIKKVRGGNQVLDTTSTPVALAIPTTLPDSDYTSSTTTTDSTTFSTTSMRAVSFGFASTIFSTVSSSVDLTTYLPVPTSISSIIPSITSSIILSIKTTSSHTEAKITSSPQVVNPIFSNLKTNPAAVTGFTSLIASPSISKLAVEALNTDLSPTPTMTPQDSTKNLFSSPSSTAAVQLNVQSSSFFSSKSSGSLSHYPGSPTASSPLACGDSYTSPATVLFVALCHNMFDKVPGGSSSTLINSNKSPVCGKYVDGRKDLNGNWLESGSGSSPDYVVVGGDGALNCVGIEGVRCHRPLTIAITYQNQTLQNVMVVDRNQDSICSSGDLDASDLVYRTLAGTKIEDENEGLGMNLSGIVWEWE